MDSDASITLDIMNENNWINLKEFRMLQSLLEIFVNENTDDHCVRNLVRWSTMCCSTHETVAYRPKYWQTAIKMKQTISDGN